jgi:general stress protein 26
MDKVTYPLGPEQVIRSLLKERGLAVLATTLDKRPHQGLVAIAATDDLKKIIFTTPTYTRKYENIQTNPAVSLLVDNRTNTEMDFLNCTALTIRGEAYVLDKEKEPVYHNLYLSRHPYLVQFLHSPSSAMLLVRVDTYTVVTSFQRVREWSPKT